MHTRTRIFVTIASLTMLVGTLPLVYSAPVRLRNDTITPAAKSAQSLGKASAADKRAYYIVQFAAAVKPDNKAAVAALGANLGDYIPENAFVAKMTRVQAEKVLALDCVSWVGPLEPKHRVEARVKSSKRSYCDIIIRLFPGESPAELQKTLKMGGGAAFISNSESGPYIHALVPKALVDKLSELESVQWIEEWRQPKLSNDVAQGLVGIPSFRQRTGYYGEGQIIAVSDTGLDSGDTSTLSADFAGRLVTGYAMKRTDWGDPQGHGTHVMGIAAGSGALSGSNAAAHSYEGSYAGMAPEAGMIIQSIGDANGMIFPPINLKGLFDPAYDDGARVHSNSWGTPGASLYTVYSQQVDESCWNHKDMVVVFSAGNSAVDANRDGVTDLTSLDSPGTAKNCITVGATESVRPSSGLVSTYGTLWSQDFGVLPISSDYISDTPTTDVRGRGMVAWSGRGPCADGRIKPDICAPGTNIISCRSQAAPTQSGWAAKDANYFYWGGTSMSAPMVAGAAALVREYYVKARGAQPSSALVKATLLNGAKDIYPGQYGSGTKKEIPGARPNNVEGWGLLDFASNPVPVLPRVMTSVDEVAGIQTNQSRSYTYGVLGTTQPLNVTLVWTDPPPSMLTGKQLVNNLDLFVTDPLGTVYRGNGTADSTNNVESVDVATPVAGTYTITVSGVSVPSGPQPFAVVVSGLLPTGYVSGVITSASGAPVSGVTITAVDGGAPQTFTTDANGSYAIQLSPSSYTVTPSKAGWTFDPPSASVTIAGNPVTGIDFSGTALPGSISGKITQAMGGRVDYVLESAHPYPDNALITYTVTGHPLATKIRLHFEEISVESNADFIQVQKADGTTVNTYTGDRSDVWTNWIDGNTAKIVLTTDYNYLPAQSYGFYISGYETELITDGPKAGVQICVSPAGVCTLTAPDGTFTVTGIEPVTQTVTPTLPHWKFSLDSKNVDVPPGGTAAGTDFLAYPPGAMSGLVRSELLTEQSVLVQSTPRPYPNNALLSYPVQQTGASRIRIRFSSIDVEPGFDWVYVLDGAGNIVDSITGWETNLWSSWVDGDSLTVQLYSDYGGEAYPGFICDKVDSLTGGHGVSGIPVSIAELGLSTSTATDGTYSFSTVDAGPHTVSVSKPYWSFMPSSTTANIVRGLETAGVNFFGILGPMPGAGYVKTLKDNEEVLLTGKVVSAGTDRFTDHFYIEETDRSSGIRIVSTTPVTAGNLVTVTGKLSTAANGERQITPIQMSIGTGTATVPAVLGMNQRMLGGGALGYDPVTGAGQIGVEGGVGLGNIGLLVRICGRVTMSAADKFYVDDGSGLQDGSGNSGVRIECENVLAPVLGKKVMVTGISSIIYDNGHYYRTVRPRDVFDVTTLP